MSILRVALANLPFPESPDASVAGAEEAIRQAGTAAADLICFPECYVPGYRTAHRPLLPPDTAFLERAWAIIANAAATNHVGVVLGTERVVAGALLISTLVINRDGTLAGFQDKVQLDPSEEGTYSHGTGRRVFQAGPLTFGVAICHEGWRYPETVRFAVQNGAQLVFLPHFHEAGPESYRPTTFADPWNTFHEKAILCRAAENTCFVAAVNYASEGSPTTSAVVDPEGGMMVYQPYGRPGVVVADINLAAATRLFATRLRPV
jgi:predicted amidohydrolase